MTRQSTRLCAFLVELAAPLQVRFKVYQLCISFEKNLQCLTEPAHLPHDRIISQKQYTSIKKGDASLRHGH
ncbi:hypothetical protein EmuJ_001112600 [Echinococcus multilocularis]|uniref:Uncharacterized protein n=1 Tax=Echinococcus multilocularis TaxID=6211 RepID=A0A068YJA9_ECHMU|nr:hypothetical protein EmuJ_001112600 [Echinococcus multilocularis]